LVFMGFLLVAAYDQAVAARPSSIREKAGLIQDVQRSQSEATTLQRQADQLQATVTRARDQALAGTGTDIVRLRQLEALTGLGAVTGGGARVSLTDATARTDPVTGQPIANPAGKVTDGDLQVVTNELWRDGAEAIAINGQRLTATSTIRTAGVTILVDFQPVVSPYRIEAIGPSNLDDRFNRSQTGADYRAIAALTGLQLRVDPVGRLTLPAATLGSFSYAYPLTGSPATAGSPVPSSSTGPAAASSSPGSGTPSPSGGR
jgi:uncharacterized protein YlxW (UPF0749 family)